MLQRFFSACWIGIVLVMLLGVGCAGSAEQTGDSGSAGTVSGKRVQRVSQEPSDEETAPVKTAGSFRELMPGRYRLREDHTLEAWNEKQEQWEVRDEGLPTRKVYPFRTPLPRRKTSLSLDPDDPGRVLLTLSRSAYLSRNAGRSWEELPLEGPFWRYDYFTASALHPEDPGRMLIGTSFHGLFESRDGGKTWKHISEGSEDIELGAGYARQIEALAYHPSQPDRIFLAADMGRSSWIFNASSKELEPVPEGESLPSPVEQHLAGEKLPEYEAGSRQEEAAGRRGLYLNSHQASGETLAGHLDFIEEHGLNSFVVDMKDDSGYLTYDTKLELPKKIDAVRERIDAQALLDKAKSRDIYTIARIVVFKDPRFFQYKKQEYALWSRSRNEAWTNFRTVVDEQSGEERRVPKEYWVDPYAREVWDYNIDVAAELAELGFDEIQFDYIRFPSDGDISDIEYRHRRPGMRRTDALESFLKLARERLDLPISTDVYGFNGYFAMEYLGQNIEVFSNYIDVLCPMYYPSHFAREFHGELSYLERARKIYQEGATQAALLTEGKILIRPYVQAFLIGGEREFEEEVYSSYLKNQIEGLSASPASGYTLWNASNNYYMVTEPLANSEEKSEER
ncbi:MAG: hypothetical protein K9L68_09400 [Spirochaetales bacterium]|nr:hypothetical protein [Spirochaetales bacterium]MCF7938801.1 hypothetical protein [Spirochaetales bacterium]